MKNYSNSTIDILRQKAEEILKSKLSKKASITADLDTKNLIHELQVHDIELELQNEELLSQRSEALEYARKCEELYDFSPSGNLVVSKAGLIMELNLVASQMLGKGRKYLKNKAFDSFVSFHSKPVFHDFFTKVFISNIKETCEIRLVDHATPNSFFLTGRVSDNQEECLISMVDITERKLTEESLFQIEQQYHSMFEKHTAVKLIIDPVSGSILNANPAAARFYGYSIDELIKMNINDINTLTPDEIKTKMNIAANGSSKCLNFRQRLASGELRDVEVYPCPVESGGKTILYSIIHDVSARIGMEKALLDAHRRLESIVEGTHVGTWEWNVQTGETVFNELWAQIVGYTLEELAPVSIKTWEKLTNPGDLDQSDELLRKHFMGMLPYYDFECRMKHKDGHWVWVHDRGRVITRTEDGKPLMMFGTHTDITERKRAEETLKESEALFKTMFDKAPMGIALIDSHTGYSYLMNPMFEKIVGRTSEQMKTIDWMSITHFDDLQTDLDNMALLNAGEISGYKMEKRYLKPDGTEVWISMTIASVYVEDKTLPRHLCMIEDITERKRFEQEINNSQEQLRKFAAYLQNVNEEERLVLAREIHDELGQILIAIKIDVGMLKQNMLKASESRADKDILIKFDHLFNLLDNTINTTRKIMTDLRPEVLYLLGFIESAELQAIHFQEVYHIKCQFESTITKLEINTRQSVALYRILQESLTNVARHSGATQVIVKLDIQANKLILEITDNGIGISADRKDKNGTFGIIGMKERAFLLGADLIISGDAHTGTCVRVEMPYSEIG